MRLDLDRIRAAQDLIDPVFLRSPVYTSPALDRTLGCGTVMKVETLNPVRSFKGRGAEVALSRIVPERQSAGVVCASAGNLGQAVAYSGAARGVPVTIIAARTATQMKIDRMRALGATVLLEGDDIELPRELARAHAIEHGATLVEDSLDVGTCEGAGTIALELLDDGVRPDVVLVALGGGALASGVGYVMKQLAPATCVVGVQPVRAPAMALSWRAGHVVTTDRADTIADGVAGRFPIPEVLDDLLQVLDDVVLVEERHIVSSMRHLLVDAGLVVEPAAALGVAAVLSQRQRFAGCVVATVICGSNVMPDAFQRWTA